jgi:hypothetical protein
MCFRLGWTPHTAAAGAPIPALDPGAPAHVHYHIVRTITVTYSFTEEIDVWT